MNIKRMTTCNGKRTSVPLTQEVVLTNFSHYFRFNLQALPAKIPSFPSFTLQYECKNSVLPGVLPMDLST